jgi:MFS family permease
VNIDTLHNIQVIAYYAVAYILAMAASPLLIGPIVAYLSRKYLGMKRGLPQRGLADAIGMTERVMYIASYLIGRPEFIAVWLVLKAAGEWRPRPDEKTETGIWIGASSEYTVFLIGNGLSVAVAVLIAVLMQKLLPPFPWPNGWHIPTVSTPTTWRRL